MVSMSSSENFTAFKQLDKPPVFWDCAQYNVGGKEEVAFAPSLQPAEFIYASRQNWPGYYKNILAIMIR